MRSTTAGSAASSILPSAARSFWHSPLPLRPGRVRRNQKHQSFSEAERFDPLCTLNRSGLFSSDAFNLCVDVIFLQAPIGSGRTSKTKVAHQGSCRPDSLGPRACKVGSKSRIHLLHVTLKDSVPREVSKFGFGGAFTWTSCQQVIFQPEDNLRHRKK